MRLNLLSKSSIDMNNQVPYPIFEKISIECNSYCNRSCSFCTRTYDKREKVRMPTELVHKVLNELAEIEYQGRVAFHFYNEVFTDNRLFSFYEKCKELGLNNYLVTNGDFLTKEKVDRLKNFNIREFALSLYDWESDEDYEKKCLKLDKELGLKAHDWEFYFIKGGDDFGNRAGYVQHKEEKQTLPLTAGCSKIEEKVDVRYDGSVVMCCLDYYGLHNIGNVKTQNIVDIWYGEIRQKQISDLRKGLRKCYELCSKCSDYVVEIEPS